MGNGVFAIIRGDSARNGLRRHVVAERICDDGFNANNYPIGKETKSIHPQTWRKQKREPINQLVFSLLLLLVVRSN
jgi:hypothetical protein